MSELNDPRVLFSAERTLLAWNRTSQGLMAFGFVVERSGLLFNLAPDAPMNAGATAMVFWAGMGFILLGVFAVIYSSRQYLTTLKTLTRAEFPPGYATHGGLILNMVVGVLGLIIAIGLYINHTS